MSLFVDNPVLKRELRGRLPGRRFARRGWRIATAIAAVIALYYYWVLLRAIWRGGEPDAHDAWGFAMYLLLILIVVIGPAVAATTITREREMQTWEMIAVTRISPAQLMLGKWIGRQVPVAAALALLLPFALVSGIHGGIGLAGTLISYAYLALNGAFFTTIGLFSSFSAKRTPSAMVLALLTSGFLCVGTYIIDGIVSMFRNGNAAMAMRVNPFVAFDSLENLMTPKWQFVHYSDYVILATCVSFEIAVIIIGLAVMMWRYRRSPAK